MAALINHSIHMTFRDIARAALQVNGLCADTVLMDFVTGKRSDILTVEHEGLSYEFKKRGAHVNFELVARIKPETAWLEVAFLSDH